MGITGELVKSVFSKTRSIKTHENNIKNNVVERKKWKASVKLYLCGDELLDSVLAEEDSASVKSSEASVMQQILHPHDAHLSQDAAKHENLDQHHSSFSSTSLDQDVAATIIQSVFRGFKVRCEIKRQTAGFQNFFVEEMKSSGRESLATSIEVLTGNSTGVVSIQGEASSVCTKQQYKLKPPLFKPKEDWDDSTLDSTSSKMKIQNRLEAMTRRERALAYAFSQQLRICSKKKHTKSDGTESNMGWSWLERWMATRQIEASAAEDRSCKELNNNEAATSTINTRPFLRKKFLDLSFEEKESCGSNEVPVQFISTPQQEKEDKDNRLCVRNRLETPKGISRRKTVPTYHYQKEHLKVSKKEELKDGENDKRQKRQKSESNSVCKDEASWFPSTAEMSQNSKSEP
ncbi:unnamed protein product [Amaranthus hypochondriacus]